MYDIFSDNIKWEDLFYFMTAYYKRWGFRGIQKRELSSNVFTCDILNVKQSWYVDIHIIPHMATYACVCVKCSVNMKENNF